MPAFSPDISGNQGISSALSFLLESVRAKDIDAARIVAGFTQIIPGGISIRGIQPTEIPADIVDIITPLVISGDPTQLEETALLAEMRRQQWESVTMTINPADTDTDVSSVRLPGPVIVMGIQTISSAYENINLDGQFRLFATTPGSANTRSRQSGSIPVYPSDNRTNLIFFNPNGTFFPIRRLIELPSFQFNIRWLANNVDAGLVQFVPMWRSLRL